MRELLVYLAQQLVDEPDKVEVGGRRARIDRRSGTAERPILRLEGATRREDAEALRGATLLVAEDVAGPLADDDYGKVIGRGGRTAQAIRTVVKAAAVKDNRRVLVDIVE